MILLQGAQIFEAVGIAEEVFQKLLICSILYPFSSDQLYLSLNHN